jgi:hypothetical protein
MPGSLEAAKVAETAMLREEALCHVVHISGPCRLNARVAGFVEEDDCG